MSASASIVPYLNVPLSTALFTVDTRDGLKSDRATGLIFNPQSPYNINIQKNQQLFSGAVQRIALTDIVLPWNIPNVNPTNNALFLEKDDLTTSTVEISPGFYKPDVLASSIQGELNGANVFGCSTWTVTYNAEGDSEFKITTGLTGIKFRVLPKLGQPKGVASEYQGSPSAGQRSSTLATMMGLDYTGPQYAAKVTGSWASMLYTRYVDIESSILCKNQNVRDTSTSYFSGQNILARLYIAYDDNRPIVRMNGEVEEYEIMGTAPFILKEKFTIPKEIQWNTQEFLPSANIVLKDEFGNQLYSISELPLYYSPLGPPSNVNMFCGNSGFVQMTFLISEAGSPSGKYTQF